MKRLLIYISAYILSLGVFTSCEDMLEPKIFSSLTDANFPKSKADIDAMLVALYAPFSHTWGVDISEGANSWCVYSTMNSWLEYSTATTDEKYNAWASEGEDDLSWGTMFQKDDYSTNYIKVKLVSMCTNMLATVENSVLEDGLKANAIAQIKCLRAWNMFLLYDFYGPVSVILDPKLVSSEEYFPRPSKEEYISWMVKDLTEAIPDLVEKTNNTSAWGRVNKGIARMLLLKIYMNDKQWDKADEVANDLLAMPYKLMDDYKDVFRVEGNDEVIWACPSGIKTPSQDWFLTYFPWDSKQIYGIDIQGWHGHFMRWDFYNTFKQGVDKRLETIAGEYEKIDGTFGSADEGAVVVKYLVNANDAKQGLISTVAFRLADVYLSKAEILAQKNNRALTQAEFDQYVKPITNRANTTSTLDMSSILSNKTSFLEFLLAERGRELYWEGWRRQDLIRYDMYIQKARDRGSVTAESKHNLFPIPYNIILQSKGVYVNNPGYDN